MGAPTPLVLLPLWCSYPLGCSYPLVLLRWVLLPLGCSYPIGCSYPLHFVFVLVDVSLLMGGLNVVAGYLIVVLTGSVVILNLFAAIRTFQSGGTTLEAGLNAVIFLLFLDLDEKWDIIETVPLVRRIALFPGQLVRRIREL